MKHSILKWFAPTAATIFTFVVWEVVVRTNIIPAFLLPAPSEIFNCFFEEGTDLSQAFGSTIFTTLVGFSISIVFGVCLGLILSLSPALQYAFYPYAMFFQTVPIVSIAPLLIIWFGYGVPSIVASAFIVSFFPIVASTLAGMASTDTALKDLFKLYKANKLQYLFKLALPYATPYILNGLKIGAGLSVIGTVVGEFLGGIGLGSIVEVSRRQQRIDKMFAAILLASLLGLIVLLTIEIISFYSIKKWRGEVVRRSR